MADININTINKYYGDVHVIKDISLDIKSQSFTVLVGPSGCGKSTMLRMIAGLEDINSGTISIDGEVVNDLPPKQRNIAMVFQSYALYPSMSVRENIIFGLKQAKTSKSKIEEQLKKVSNFLKVDELLNRKPSQLSGGQRQRVAMGRALVREPRIFLFDEPLSNLDAKLRVDMRHEIKKLYTTLKTTMVYVTHDQIEAMSLASKIAVMNKGIIQQLGKPQEIYDKPNSLFVADFIGTPSMNFIKGVLLKESDTIMFSPDSEDFKFDVSKYDFIKSFEQDQKVILGIRPEYVSNNKNSEFLGKTLSMKPTMIETTGYDKNVTFEFSNTEIVGRFSPSSKVNLENYIDVFFDLSLISIFDQKTELRL